MFRALIIQALLIFLSLQLCGKGCLKCNTNNACVFCDTINNYYLSGIECAVSSQETCLILASDGRCAQCMSDYYLDASTSKCVAVESSNKVDYCALYGSAPICIKCIVTQFVDHCEYYAADGKCSECFPGYILDINRVACVESPANESCATYSYIECRRCAKGYIFNPNYYFEEYSVDHSRLYSDIIDSYYGFGSDWSAVKTCQKVIVPNCLIASASDVCEKCAPEYYVASDKSCRLMPRRSIENCLVYDSLSTCKECQQGYFRPNKFKCEEISAEKLIPDCDIYSSTSDSVKCLKCVSSKYLSQNTCDSNRKDSLKIEHCLERAIDSDTCETCEEEYLPSSVGKTCLLKVANCLLHKSSQSTDTQLVCLTCKPGYFLQENQSITACIAGQIPNCLDYNSNGECLKCDPSNYYLKDNRCVQHPTVDKCLIYDETSSGECRVCDTGYLPFKLVRTCQQLNRIIPSCIKYQLGGETCAECKDGFYLKNDGFCYNLSDIPQCKSVDVNGLCTACEDWYALDKVNNSCKINHDHVIMFCNSVSSNAEFNDAGKPSSSQCRVCKENSYPFDLSGFYACFDETLFKTRGLRYQVENCKRYNNEEVPKCLECKSKYFLVVSADDSIRYCSSECDSMSNTILLEDPFYGTIKTCQYAYDSYTFGMNNCAIATIAIDSSTRTKVCLRANASSKGIAVTNLFYDTENKSYWRDVYDSTVPQPDYSFIYYGFRTVVEEISQAKHNRKVPTPNTQNLSTASILCEVYFKDGPSIYCWRCKWEFVVKLDPVSGRTSCSKMATCDTSKSFGGFSATLNQLLTCHTCASTSQVLTVQVKVTNGMSAGHFEISGLASGKFLLECQEPNSTLHTALSPKYIEGCQIYATLYDGSNNFYSTDGSGHQVNGCVACAPGYKPYDNTKVFTTCVKIIYCDDTIAVIANRCSVCAQKDSLGNGQSFAFGDFSLQSCIPSSTENCLINSTTLFHNVYLCRVCKPGYWLNEDFKCEHIQLPQCLDFFGETFFSLQDKSQTSIAEYYALRRLSGQNTIQGCDTCANGFVAFRMPRGERQCVYSSYVHSINTSLILPVDSKFVPDCLKYRNQFDPSDKVKGLCSECTNQKIPNSDGTRCLRIAIANCAFAESDGHGCHACKDGFLLANNECLFLNIDNCAEYDMRAIVSEVQCNKCKEGYIISENRKKCIEGTLIGCHRYASGDPFTCEECSKGYYKLNTANNRIYCLAINRNSNCDHLDTDSDTGLQAKLYNCQSCYSDDKVAFSAKPYMSNEVTKPKSICMPLNPVANCICYDTGLDSISRYSLLCVACKDGYFVDERRHTCVPRTNMPVACLEYEPNKDLCKICNSMTFLSPDATDCIAFPSGIVGCNNYFNNTHCSDCRSPMYLYNNTCITSTIVPNCIHYSANYTCSQCEKGYYLANETYCEVAKAQNCHTYLNARICEQCDPENHNKGLKALPDGTISCVEKDLVQCEISTPSFPFRCIKCSKGYYAAADGSCQPAIHIHKCVEYSTATSCAVCEPGTILSTNGFYCDDINFTSEFDPNCIDARLLKTAQCSKCSSGHIFSDGNCIPCEQNTLLDGCFSCVPKNQSVCFACRSGYYQVQNGTCLSIHNTTNPRNVKMDYSSSSSLVDLAFLALFIFAALI